MVCCITALVNRKRNLLDIDELFSHYSGGNRFRLKKTSIYLPYPAVVYILKHPLGHNGNLLGYFPREPQQGSGRGRR